MSSVPPGTSAYNWLRQQQLKNVATTTGLQLSQLKASDPKAICGRQIDSSVAVGGVGSIPINSDSITPDLIQGHAFVAPTYVGPTNHGNLLLNPTAEFALSSWFKVDFGVTGQTTYTTDSSTGTQYKEFTINYPGGAHVDSLLCQDIYGLTVGSTMTASGIIKVLAANNELGAAIGLDIVSIDQNGNGYGPDIGYGGGIIAADYNHLVVAPATPFSFQFVVPSSGNIQVRMRVENGPSSILAFGASFSQLKVEYGSLATSFNLASFDAATEVDISGVMHSIITTVGFTNIPMNAIKVLWCYKNTNSSTWVPWAETTIPGLPYPPQQQALSFSYGQLAFGINYDFGAAYVDLQGNVGSISAFATNFNPSGSIFTVNSSYMKTFGGTFTPSFLSTPALHSILSANGISSSVTMDFTINNQPTDGSLSRVSVWYRVTPVGGSSTPEGTSNKYTFYGSVPAVGVGLALSALPTAGTYSFTFSDLTNKTSYDFAISCEDSSGGETALIYAQSLSPQTIVIPPTPLPSHPANAYIQASATSVQYGQSGQSSYYSQLSVTILITDGPGGAALDPSAWLSQIRFLAKPIATDTGSGDHDLNPNDYTICNTIYTNTISNPIIVIVGPFPANIDQEIAVQLVDQAGKVSAANPFEITLPPGPVFDNQGRLQYTSFGTPLTQIITPSGTLQNGVVARAQMATPATGNNLLFNPTGYFGTTYWNTYNGSGNSVAFFGSDQFNGGRFRLYWGNQTSIDYVAEQQLSNLTPGQPMVMSGLIELDANPSGLLGYAMVEAYDPASVTLAEYHVNFPNQGPLYFEFKFNVPDSGTVQIRMHISNGGSGPVDAYFYKLQLEHGTQATPFNDAMASSAAANTHTPYGRVSINNGTVTNGQIDYNAAPGSVQAVINNTSNSYNANLPTPGSIVPYDSINGAYQIATGRNGELQNGLVSVFPTAAYSGLSAGTVLFLPSTSASIYAGIPANIPAGRWQYTIYAMIPTSNVQLNISVQGTAQSLPSGLSSVVNCNTYGPALTGMNSISGSFVVTGGQFVNVGVYGYFVATGSSCSVGTLTVQTVRIG